MLHRWAEEIPGCDFEHSRALPLLLFFLSLLRHFSTAGAERFPASEAPISRSPAGRPAPGELDTPWMLAGEQRECFLLVRNAAASLALGELTVAVFPQDIVSVTSASLLSEEEAAASAVSPCHVLQQHQQAGAVEAVGGPLVGGLPMRVVSLEASSSSSRMVAGQSDCSSSVRLFSLLPGSIAGASATEGSSVTSTVGGGSCCLVPPGMTACLRLSVRAAYAGLHRVRFCLMGQPLQQQQQHTAEAGGHGGEGNLQPVWRAVEALLAVAPSLELYVQPVRHLLQEPLLQDSNGERVLGFRWEPR